jgi:phenylalanyl-tRNA synthetase beta chain
VVAAETVAHDELIGTALAAVPEGVVRSVCLFDVYRPASPGGDIRAGEKSLAIRLELRDDEATLTDERIEIVVDGVLAALRDRLGVRLRS